ncbi:MAG: hypothetical protein PHZ00_02270 [Candidatus Peribacteraceae bacterium]|nr:hypothetical protein [Candidatus Peribacteraceae bacterium]
MPTTQTTDDPATDGSAFLPLKIPDMAVLFDLFMQEVDPRFTHAGQPELKKALAAATPAEKQVIAEQYESALIGFQQWIKVYFRELKGAIGKYRRSMEDDGQQEGLLSAESALDIKNT